MLLSSSLPFYGKDRTAVTNKILKNKFKFKGRRWKAVSSRATAFINSLLVWNPDKRSDAERALGSAWLNPYVMSGPTSATRGPREEEEELARSSMLRFAGYSKLKKMVRINAW